MTTHNTKDGGGVSPAEVTTGLSEPGVVDATQATGETPEVKAVVVDSIAKFLAFIASVAMVGMPSEGLRFEAGPGLVMDIAQQKVEVM